MMAAMWLVHGMLRWGCGATGAALMVMVECLELQLHRQRNVAAV
jgi:hypothetical protein